MCNNLIEKLFLYPHVYAQLPANWQAHGQWLFQAGSLIPQSENDKQLKIIRSISRAFSGFRFGMATCWPLLFTILLIYDLLAYAFSPLNRYGTTLWDIILGTATNQATLTSRWGGDLAGKTFDYWFWPVVLLAMPFVFALVNTLLPRDCFTIHADVTATPSWWGDNIIAINPFHSLVKELENATHRVVWSDELETIVKQRQGLLRFRGLAALAAIVDSTNVLLSTPESQHQWRATRRDALLLLHHVADRNVSDGMLAISFVTSLYAEYLLHTIGQGQNHWVQPLYWLLLPLSLLMSIRYGEVFVNKLMGLGDYYALKNHCESNNLFLQYIPAKAKYGCSICADWPFVYATQIFSAENCAKALFAQPLPPAMLLNYLQRLQGFTYLTVDLSNLLWTRWPANTLESVLNAFSGTHLDNFRLAGQFTNTTIDAAQCEVINNFLRQHTITNIEFDHLNLGTLMQNLLSGIVHAMPSAIDVSSNQLNGTVFSQLLTTLPKENLQRFTSWHNPLTPEVIKHLANWLQGSGVKQLLLGGKSLSQEALNSLSAALPHQLAEFSLRYQDFSMTNFTIFTQSISQITTLKTLDLTDVQLNDASIGSLIQNISAWSVETLILTNNQVSDFGFIQLITALANQPTKIKALILDKNQITNYGLECVSSLLARTGLENLSLAGNKIDITGFSTLVGHLAESTIKVLSVAYNNLGNQAGTILAAAYANQTLPLVAIDLTAVGLADNGTQAFFAGCVNSTVSIVRIAGNSITDVSAAQIAAYIASKLGVVLDLRNNQLTINGIKILAKALPGSLLKEFYLDGNSLAGCAPAIIENVISSTPRLPSDGAASISLDEQRALALAKKLTNLEAMSLGNTNLGPNDARLICRGLVPSKVNFTSKTIADNPAAADAVDLDNCEILSRGDSDDALDDMQRDTRHEWLTNDVSHRHVPMASNNLPRLTANNSNNAMAANGAMLVTAAPWILLILGALFVGYLLYRLSQMIARQVRSGALNRYAIFAPPNNTNSELNRAESSEQEILSLSIGTNKQ